MEIQPLEIEVEVSFGTLVEEAEKLCDRRNKEALPYIEDAISYAKSSGNSLDLYTTRYLQAYYSTFVLSEFEEGIDIIKDLLNTIDADDLNEIGYKLYMTLGNAFQSKGDVFEAQQSYLKGIRTLEDKPTLSEKEKRFQGAYYYNIALLLSASQLKLDTEEYLKKAIEIYTELHQSFKLSKCYLVYGSYFEKTGDNIQALEMFEKALAIDTQNKDAYSTALTRANMGYIHSKMGDDAFALGHFHDALQYFEQNERLYETGMAKLGLGQCLFKMGDKQRGLELIHQAENLFINIDNRQDLSDCYQVLATLLKADKQFEQSIAYLEKYTETLRHFFDIDKTNALARAKREFESEQREKESQLLKQKNEEIQQYVYKLENSNNSLKQFAHVASHDLREPLRMINSYMTLLERSMTGNISTQQRDFLDFALDGAKRMDNLIIAMLQLAKVDANPRIEHIKLENIIEEIRLNLDVLLKEKNAMIVSGNLPEIKADRTQMLQLFQNLIANGLKYNESKTPMVKLKCSITATGFEIAVTDNGIGIPQQSRQKVFDIFTRLSAADKYSGSGIGLSICKKIVDSMNGKISIDENPNGGTIFRIGFKNEQLLFL